ncbi:MAG: hydrolase TatD [Firmicutes bacterium HGW-Firmicutes-1]|jgi:TatD DNase family protein|nr:MAG: hydrolase TatD [Firmicutes bacterium HGW-Firmicutes-1]
MFFESHAHYDDLKFEQDRDTILSSVKEQNITKVINVAANMASSLHCIELAKKYDFIYATVGVHPHDVGAMLEDDLETLIGLSAYDKVVAIGEIGLDYYYENSPKEVQRLWFREQINIAKDIGLPIIVHSRDASKETYELIKDSRGYEVGGVIHCFSGSKEMAQAYVDMGFYIGVGGVVTYDNAKTLQEVVRAIPLKNILIETDSPYLSPVPNRGKRNDSRNLQYVVKAIAKLKEISEEEVIKTTYDNGLKLFMGNSSNN